MIREYDRVVVVRPIASERLKEGDIGTVVHCYSDGLAFEVEFNLSRGAMPIVATLESKDLRPA